MDLLDIREGPSVDAGEDGVGDESEQPDREDGGEAE